MQNLNVIQRFLCDWREDDRHFNMMGCNMRLLLLTVWCTGEKISCFFKFASLQKITIFLLFYQVLVPRL